MNLTIVIPAYNEARRIQKNLREVVQFCEQHAAEWEIIVVDDGSSDATVTEIEAVDAGGIHCLRNEVNRGKGYSVRRGMLAARLQTVLFMDADLSTPIAETLTLYRELEKGADVVIASRRQARHKTVQRTPLRKLMATTFRWCVKILALRGISDTQCGFKMFRQEVVQPIFSLQRLERWGFDVEILFIARKNGLRIAEAPVDWEESDETRLTAGAPLSMLLDLLRVRGNDILGRYRYRPAR